MDSTSQTPTGFWTRTTGWMYRWCAGEARTQSFSYVMDQLAVLSLVHLDREGVTRIVSFRYASEEESEIYHDWLEKDAADPTSDP